MKISLEVKFMTSTKLNDEIIGSISVDKKTKSLVFLSCVLKSKKKTIASSSGIWKILDYRTPRKG